MSNFLPPDGEYPNQFLGVNVASDTNAGAVNRVEAPLKLATAAGVGGAILNSGSGAPGIGGNVGDLYVRTDGTHGAVTVLYQCTGAGTAGNATWAGIA